MPTLEEAYHDGFVNGLFEGNEMIDEELIVDYEPRIEYSWINWSRENLERESE